jgi:hypothetical protein
MPIRRFPHTDAKSDPGGDRLTWAWRNPFIGSPIPETAGNPAVFLLLSACRLAVLMTH